MKRYYYDLHIHSCLSPCADDDNTPNNLAGIASLSEIDILALTDHNTTENCPAFFAACERFGIIPIAGMELTTSEDIHAVCLFEKLEDAMLFNEFIKSKRFLIKNRTEIFGRQLVMNSEDEIIREEEHLLSNATSLSIEEVYETVIKYGGVCYPAHIERISGGIIGILGSFPESAGFTAYEISDKAKEKEIAEKYSLKGLRTVVSSDAHTLSDVRDKENYFEFRDALSPDEIRHAVISYLRKEDERIIP